MPVQKISIQEFLLLSRSIPVVDVRSPSEFLHGHIPGAHNIPLFSDEERAAVGTKYKREGRIPAILEGLKHTGSSFITKLDSALRLATGNKLLVHCWRGGMRSEAMAWLFSLGDISVSVLEGGYKAYRQCALETLAAERKLIILGGMTGSSKTHILRYIGSSGHQFVDLEGIANHKGSAFGALGQAQQPPTEHFGNMLFDKIRFLDNDKPLWLEDESRSIGSVFIPDEIFTRMQQAPTIVLMMPIEVRLPRLLEEYSCYPPEALNNSIVKISKRLGGDNTREALEAVKRGDFRTAITIVLEYYDKAYLHSIKRKANPKITWIESDTDEISVNAGKIMKCAESL